MMGGIDMGLGYDKDQFNADAANVDKQMAGAAKAFGTNKWILYAAGVLAAIGAVAVLGWLIN